MILLDTHVRVWLAADSKRLSRTAAAAIRRATESQDPADRLIGATARSLGLALVTRDREVLDSKLLETIW